MKTILLSLILTAATASAQQRFSLSVTNPTEVRIDNLPVSFDISRCADVTTASVSHNGRSIPCQLDDLNSDGRADELFFVDNLTPHATLNYTITLNDPALQGHQPDVQPRVYADMMLADKKDKHPLITALSTPGDSYVYSDLYHHGAAFENEFTAYRLYFDHRQNIDIYGKKYRRLELADTHFYTTAEQQAQGYGNDVLWAGKSVGCGTLKLWDGSAPADWKDVSTRTQRILAAGPLRTIVEIEDRSTRLPSATQSAPTTITTRYSLYAGHREVRIDIRADRPLPEASLCTGVQKVGSSPIVHTTPQVVVTSWGSDYPEQSSDKMREQFPPETVGMAVFVPRQFVARQLEDQYNSLVLLGHGGEQQMYYYVTFCADKEEAGIHSDLGWFVSLPPVVAQLEAQNNKVRISVKKAK